MKCRAVLFDLFDTLLYCVETGTREKAMEVAEAAGITRQDWLRGWRASFEPAARGAISSIRERVELALKVAGESRPDPGMVDELAGLLSARGYPQLCPDVRGALAELRQRGYRLALVSNIGSEEKEIVNTFDLAQLFDAVILSCAMGALKPEPGIYLLAAERLGVSPSECAFVDDSPSFVEAAKAVGMFGVWIDRGGEREEEPAAQAFDLRIENLGDLLAWLPPQAGGNQS